MRATQPFKKDSMVLVDWIDTANSATGDPDHASPETRHTLGFCKGVKKRSFVNKEQPKEQRSRQVLVISDTKDDALSGQEGWTAIPLPNVLAITEVVVGKKRWVP
jgi:hypothetical protein